MVVLGNVWSCGRGLCGARPWWSGTTRWGCQLPVLGSPGCSGGVMLRLGGWGEVGVGCWVGSGDIGAVVGAGGGCCVGCWVGSVVGLCGGSVVGVLGGWGGSWVGVGEEDGVPVGVAVGLVVGVVELVGAGDGVITVGFAVGGGVGVGGGPSKTPGWRSVGMPGVSSQASPMPSPS